MLELKSRHLTWVGPKVFLEQINRQEMKNEKKRLQRIVSQILKHFDRNSHQLL